MTETNGSQRCTSDKSRNPLDHFSASVNTGPTTLPDRSPLVELDCRHGLNIDMASNADDLSIDGSFSSVTDSQWDVVDEASAASGDDPSGISRQPTPFSDSPERLHLDTGSLASNDTSSDGQGFRAINRLVEFNRSRKDSASDPPDTAKRIRPVQSLYKDIAEFDLCREDQRCHIEFSERSPSMNYESSQVVFNLTAFNGEKRKQIAERYHLDGSAHVKGTLRQTMSRSSVQLGNPFKILYHGPVAVKSAIVEKVGAALAAHLSSSTSSVMESSRVTVVPVSAITENNAPDVVLIDSMGLDMHIEECTSAHSLREEAPESSIVLTVNNQKVVESSWSRAENAFKITPGYQLPHIAIIYKSDSEALSISQTRNSVELFLARHDVPIVAISSTPEWDKGASPVAIDERSPHLCIENVNAGSKDSKVLERFPVDLNTFLSIDAGQMNRNLSWLVASNAANRATHEPGRETAQTISLQGHKAYSRLKKQDPFPRWSGLNAPVAKLPMLLLSAAWILFVLVAFRIYHGDVLSHSVTNPVPSRHALEKQPPLSVSATSRGGPRSALAVSPHASAGLDSPTKSAELVSLLIETTNATPTNSEKFRAQVVGDNHIVLRPPPWFSEMRKSPTLHFKVQRGQKEVDFKFLSVFDGVFALRIPPQDAHGILDVSVWTLRRPRINEKLQVNLGTPWLKAVDWWKAAQAMAHQVKSELTMKQSSLAKLYTLANQQLDKAEQAFKEVERVSLESARVTSLTTKKLIEHSRKLSKSLSQHMHWRKDLQTQRLQQELADYSRFLSSALLEQMEGLRAATAKVDLLAVRHKIQAYRQRNFRKAQIRMLHTWWKFRSAPARLRKQSRQAQSMRDSLRFRTGRGSPSRW